jgi:hypothetical protein
MSLEAEFNLAILILATSLALSVLLPPESNHVTFPVVGIVGEVWKA